MTQTDVAPSAAVRQDVLHLVSFTLGRDEFGVEVHSVLEIDRMPVLSRVPTTPECVEGFISLRGMEIPVINLRRCVGMCERDADSLTRIIVVEIHGSVFGVVVDNVCEFLRIPRSVTGPPPALVGEIQREFITAVGNLKDRLLILLDLSKIMETQGIRIAQVA